MSNRIHTAVVLGAGKSGHGAARLLRSQGAEVWLLDESDVSTAVAEEPGIHLQSGKEVFPKRDFDVAIVSPGFALSHPWVEAARCQAGEMVAELEWGWRHLEARCVAVTGSNGKSTLVKWIAETWARAGYSVVAAGNYGRSVCDVALQTDPLDWLILEVSSFQLETVSRFRPDMACCTNVFPNHLNRHGDLETYARLKARLFAQQGEGDTAFVPPPLLDDFKSWSGGAGKWTTFGVTPGADYSASDGKVASPHGQETDFSGTPFGGVGAGSTAAAMIGLCEAAGVDPALAVEVAKDFVPLPHRLQVIGRERGITYMNDSKATNLAATAHALQSITAPVRLIAGGVAKEKDFEILNKVLTTRVKSAYIIGNSAEEMSSAWSNAVSCELCGTLDKAVERARDDARDGEVILLSPGCASFDQYRSFEERGEHFIRLVALYTGKETS